MALSWAAARVRPTEDVENTMNNPHSGRQAPEHQLLAEIAWYEARLRELGSGAECAYEKALARSFEQALVAQRARLAALRTG
jgi:hypothetical protein